MKRFVYWTMLVVGFVVFCTDTVLGVALTFTTHEETALYRIVFVAVALISLLGLVAPGGLMLAKEVEKES